MSEYVASVVWSRQANELFIDNKYSRAHQWQFDGGARVDASSAPDIVPLPYSVAENVDPEEAFIASLSSCHMLFFLSIAAKNKLTVDSYQDDAVGLMQQTSDGRMSMTQVTLKPCVQFTNNEQPSIVDLEAMHHQAHELCFIANSVKTAIVIEIVQP
ncbi:OsmC family protein [Pseudoalteromonas arctica]|uniref:OsmC family peroxiredoxin n=1 Tax=Pseudoalteromonas arctica TaxID=394751 RepID=A0A7Y0DVQ6_9GAMM|nr:OsmC family protein [Pseudoalteromonas arctica]NMM42499.1 OsmC family peroxiredoxin [Pseudoalteromonas arctica]